MHIQTNLTTAHKLLSKKADVAPVAVAGMVSSMRVDDYTKVCNAVIAGLPVGEVVTAVYYGDAEAPFVVGDEEAGSYADNLFKQARDRKVSYIVEGAHLMLAMNEVFNGEGYVNPRKSLMLVADFASKSIVLMPPNQANGPDRMPLSKAVSDLMGHVRSLPSENICDEALGWFFNVVQQRFLHAFIMHSEIVNPSHEQLKALIDARGTHSSNIVNMHLASKPEAV